MITESTAGAARAVLVAAVAGCLLGVVLTLAAALASGVLAQPRRAATVDLSVTLAGPADVAPGAVGLVYAVQVTNAGPDPAVDVAVTQTLPAPFVFVSASDAGALSGSDVRWTLAELPLGAARTVSVTMAVPRAAPVGEVVLAAVARAAGDEVAAADNSSQRTVSVSGADLRLTIGPGAAQVRPGEAMTHTLTLANVSKSAAQGVVVTATLASGTQFLSDDAGAQGFSRTLLPGAVRWSRPDQPGLATRFIDLVTIVATDVPPGQSLVHHGRVESATLDGRSDNDIAAAGPVRVVLPDLWLRQTGPAEGSVGGEVEFTLRYGNQGDGVAPAVVVTNALPAGLVYASSLPPADVGPGGTLSWRAGRLPAGGEDLIRVRARVAVTVPPGAMLVNRAGVTAGSLEGPRADNAASATLAVVPGVPAQVALTAPTSVPVTEDSVPVAVVVRDIGGNLVADGTEVRLSTTLGTLAATRLTTAGGTVATTLAPGRRAGPAVLRSEAGAVAAEQTVDLRPGPPDALRLVPADAAVTVDETLALTLTVTDAYDNAVSDGTPVALGTDLGTVTPSEAQTAAGTVAVAWRSTVAARGSVTATVAARSTVGHGTFRPGPPAVLAVAVSAPQLPVNDGQSTVEARVMDRYSNLVSQALDVRFTVTGGVVQPATVRTSNGLAATTYRAGAVPGTYTVQATTGALSASAEVALRPADLVFVAADVMGPRGRARDTQTHPGEALTYTVRVRNDGLAKARAVVLGLSLPVPWEVSDVQVVGGGGEEPGVPPGLLEPPGDDQAQRAWRLPDLAAGAVAELVLRGRVSRTATWIGQDNLHFQSAITTTTAVARPAGLRRQDTAGVYTADLYVKLQLDSLASRLVPGGEAVYDLSFGNRQPLTDLRTVRITDTVPAWMTFDHWAPRPGASVREVGVLGPSSRQLVWEPLPPYGIGAGLRLWLAIDPDAPPDVRFENVVRIGSDVQDITPADDQASDGGIGLRGVNLVATVAGPAMAEVGAPVDVDVIVRNAALQDAAHGVVVDAYPPSGAVVVGAEPPGQSSAGRLRWQLETLPPGGEQRYTLHLRVPDGAVVGSLLRTRSEVASADQDRYLDDNGAEHLIRVAAGSPAVVTVIAGRPAVPACDDDAGGTVLTATVRDARGASVADGTVVGWSTDLGSLSSVTSTVRSGLATATLRAGGAAPGLARVTARAGAATGRLDIPLVPGLPASLGLIAEPAVVPPRGQVTLTATARDTCGYAVADGTPIRLSAERGAFATGTGTITAPSVAGRSVAALMVGDVAGPIVLVARHDALQAETVVTVRGDAVVATATPLAPLTGRVWLPFALQRRPR